MNVNAEKESLTQQPVRFGRGVLSRQKQLSTAVDLEYKDKLKVLLR
jgi:hypothetical protein